MSDKIPDPNELPPDDKVDDGLATMIQRVKEYQEKEHAKWQAFMATQPQTRPCRFHPDVLRPIDEEASKDASRYAPETMVAGYAQCPKCAERTKNLELKKYGVPENLIHATFKNFRPKDEVEAGHVEVVRRFCDGRTGFLILSGSYGTGKTHLAVAALRRFGGGWLVKQATLLRLLRATYGDRDAEDPIEKAQSTLLLVLDDVGLSGGGKDELPMLHEILDCRHGGRLPTIITTNLPFEKLSSVLGERVADRLRESTFRVLNFAGSSHRRDARERYFDAPPAEPPTVLMKIHYCL